MRIGIIGMGRMGERRREVLTRCGDQFSCGYDLDSSRCAGVGSARACIEWSDAVIIATDTAHLTPFAMLALEQNRHVFIEKPGALTSADLQKCIDRATRAHCALQIGYNHRFHPAARGMMQQLEGEDPWYVSGFYGHGGRPGYEKDWRQTQAGEWLDQLPHLIDLSTLVLGLLVASAGRERHYRWGPADNTWAILRGEKNERLAHLHTSYTAWRNRFHFEVTTAHKLIVWEGLGGSYGRERLTIYRHPQGQEGKYPGFTMYEYPEDDSLEAEWHTFREQCQYGTPHPTCKDAVKTLELIERLQGNAS